MTTGPTAQRNCAIHLIHLCNQSIDLVFPVPQVASLHKVPELPCSESTGRVTQLERPQEVACLLKIWAHGVNLMDQVLHTDNTVLAQVVLDDLVVGERDALLFDLAISTLVDQLTHSLEIGIAVSDIGLDNLEHFECRFGEADKDAVIDLEETKELEDLAGLGGDLVDTVE